MHRCRRGRRLRDRQPKGAAGLANKRSPPHAPVMFVVTEADAAAIRAVYEQRGEFAAAVELRRRFPDITDNAQGTGVRAHHRRLEAAAAATGEADAQGAAVRANALSIAG
jgi:hypothetical protein